MIYIAVLSHVTCKLWSSILYKKTKWGNVESCLMSSAVTAVTSSSSTRPVKTICKLMDSPPLTCGHNFSYTIKNAWLLRLKWQSILRRLLSDNNLIVTTLLHFDTQSTDFRQVLAGLSLIFLFDLDICHRDGIWYQ